MQELCPDGQYPSGSPATCQPCTANHYCPAGTPYPLKCPAGTKGNGATGAKDRFEGCTICTSSEVCPRYGTGGGESDYVITPGDGFSAHPGLDFKQSRPCSWGTYDNNAAGSNPSGSDAYLQTGAGHPVCAYCEEGYACGLGTSDPSYTGGT